MNRQTNTDRTKLKYVLYVRKSTEDGDRQVRSIDDQIKDCERLAANDGLNVVEVICESKSAKKPGLRPLFTQMLRNIEAGKYDAIICWHPDRLCRNMLEGGQIINMLDENQLKDIRFHSHQFSNDANGKMLLGMLFVFSKQYSDDLSDKVNRGVQGNLSEGKSSGTPKWGYTRSEVTGHYEPNEHFDTVKEAWAMRANGESLISVTNFLNTQGVNRLTKNVQRQRAVRMTKSTASNMFHDPFYYGVLVQSGQNVDLRDVTLGFVPMIDKETYDLVQAIGYGRVRGMADQKRKTFYPLHGFVYCAVCGSNRFMKVGKNRNGSGQHVLTYRCDYPGCERKPKSIRARNVFESIYERLESFEWSDEAYKRYSDELDGMTAEKITAIREDIFSKRGALNHITKQVKDISLNVGRMSEKSPAYKPNMDELERLATQQAGLEVDIKTLEAKIANPDKIKLSKDDFLNVLKTAAHKMRAGTAVEKDVLCRILLLNVHVDNEKVAIYHWREPFATLIEATEIVSGGGGWS